MLTYRLYFLGADGRITRSHEFECDDDAAAIAVVRQHPHAHVIELWQQARLVRTFDPKASD